MVSHYTKRIYFQELSDKKILSKKEQLNCARDIATLKKKLLRCKSKKKEEKIKEKIRVIRDKLILSCTFIVVKIAKKYRNRYLSLFDLIEEGNFALIKAIDSFDETRNVKFSTYVSVLIKNKILTAIAHRGKMVRVNDSNQYNGGRFVPIISPGQAPFRTFTQQLGVDSSKMFRVLKNLQQYRLEHELKLDQEAFDDFFIYKYNDQSLPEFYLFQKALTENLKKIKKILTERENTIIEKYYGLNQNKPKRYNKIAKEMQLTSERVRQIHNKAIMKIKNSDLVLILKGFLSDT